MAEGIDLALATSSDNTPNVRIMLFAYDPEKKVVYVPTYSQSPKVTEITNNNKVAFTTVPVGFDAVRVSNATIKKSDLSVNDVKDAFIKKSPGFQATVDNAGTMMDIY
ncbi:hypothetical protein CSC2_07380 [Clostridium zeae]|uniref:Pyridoxamine 5'-phosphate oxidase-like domain-containing protein n=1 Tax=Clostridium zeae TaxID=2759022 RepID=A0ABQ1E628_9CLOT|nr:pyridoxamine 5'-phosphate oxidase family protein [Clostridium zeae]GFZ30212.1 hypothetical protein CSC2_07380 [Clostridium zeae]